MNLSQAFGQGPAIGQERLMTGTVTSSSAPNCGGPMQQYYNSGCGENGQQQSYMHMTQSQGMTFSQQRSRLLSAGASPTNIRPPNGVQQQQQQPNINSEHHMLPQHMNRTPVSTFDFLADSLKIINFFCLESNEHDGPERMSTAATGIQTERGPKHGHVSNAVRGAGVHTARSTIYAARCPVQT